jgi:hypothetical protein
MEYAGWIEEILELNYRSHCCIVLLCSWIPAKVVLGNTKILQNKYGFAVGNFVRTMPPSPESFAFPTHCKQVFFSNDEKLNEARGGDWKVILGTTVRGRRNETQPTSGPDIEVLASRRDEEFEGLRIMLPTGVQQ